MGWSVTHVLLWLSVKTLGCNIFSVTKVHGCFLSMGSGWSRREAWRSRWVDLQLWNCVDTAAIIFSGPLHCRSRRNRARLREWIRWPLYPCNSAWIICWGFGSSSWLSKLMEWMTWNQPSTWWLSGNWSNWCIMIVRLISGTPFLIPQYPWTFSKEDRWGSRPRRTKFHNWLGTRWGIYDGLTFIRATQCQCYFILWEDINSWHGKELICLVHHSNTLTVW